MTTRAWKRRLLVFALATILSFAVLSTANPYADGIVDQQCSVRTGPGAGLGPPPVGQIFTPAHPFLLGFAFNIQTPDDLPANITVAVRDLRFDALANGPLVATENFSVPGQFNQGEFTWFTARFSSPVHLEPGGRYAVEVTASYQSGTTFVMIWSKCGVDYQPGGSYSVRLLSSGYSSPPSIDPSDLVFLTYSGDYNPFLTWSFPILSSLLIGSLALITLHLSQNLLQKRKRQASLDSWARPDAKQLGSVSLLSVIIVSALFVPVLMKPAAAQATYSPHSPIHITGNGDFTAANGVTGGTGTVGDPYIIEGWDINATVDGITVKESTVHFVVRNNFVHQQSWAGGLSSGILLINANNSRIERNIVVGFSYAGIRPAGGSNINIVGNTISSTAYHGAILVEYGASDVAITGNNLSANSRGITLSGVGGYPDNVTISLNNIFGNSALGITGEVRNVTIHDNNISGNRGSSFKSGVSPGAISIRDPFSNPSIFRNNFILNLPQGGGPNWDGGYPTGGNFWSDYAGVDNCSGPAQDNCSEPDGIGDKPHFVNAEIVDRYPLVGPNNATSDTGPPNWPQGASLSVTGTGPTSVTLSWPAAVDDIGIVGYRLYRGQTLLATVPGTVSSYTVFSLEQGVSHSLAVEAVDVAGHGSATRLTTAAATTPWWQQYLYVIAAAVSGVAIASVFLGRKRLKHLQPTTGSTK